MVASAKNASTIRTESTARNADRIITDQKAYLSHPKMLAGVCRFFPVPYRSSFVNVSVYSLTMLGDYGAAPVSVSFAFGPHSSAGAVNATVRDWPSGITVSFTLTLFPKVLNAKQGNSMDV